VSGRRHDRGGTAAGGQVPYSDGAFTGVQQTWSNCQDTTGMIRVLVVNPPTLAYTLVVSVQTTAPAGAPTPGVS
jgi:hypothetical protein